MHRSYTTGPHRPQPWDPEALKFVRDGQQVHSTRSTHHAQANAASERMLADAEAQAKSIVAAAAANADESRQAESSAADSSMPIEPGTGASPQSVALMSAVATVEGEAEGAEASSSTEQPEAAVAAAERARRKSAAELVAAHNNVARWVQQRAESRLRVREA